MALVPPPPPPVLPEQIAPKIHNTTNHLINATEIDLELLYFTEKFGAA